MRIKDGLAGVVLGVLLTSTPGLADEQRGDPAARLLPGVSASELWELTAQFDSGHRLFAEFLITNIGFGDRNAVAVGHLVEPNGKTHRFRNSRRKGRWGLSADRRRLEIGASLLDLHAPVSQLRVTKRRVQVDLHFRLDDTAVWSDAFAPFGYALDLLDIDAPVAGTLWIRGMEKPLPVKGVAVLAHSWMNKTASDLILRRIEFFSLHPACSVYAVDLVAPDGIRRRWMVTKKNGAIDQEVRQLNVTLGGTSKKLSAHGYPVPTALRLHSPGIEGQVRLERLLLRDDPLSDLPGPLRFLVSLVFNLQPQRVWAASSFTVAFPPNPATAHQPDHSPPALQGTGVTAVTFLNPVRPSQAQALVQLFEDSGANRRLEQPASGS